MKMRFLIFVVLISVLAQSCNKKGCTDPVAINYDESATKDDGSCEPEIVICFGPGWNSGVITSDETWTADHIYQITGKVIVSSGATLSIEPGTIIKATEGTGTLASMLIVERGGKIHAEGTAQSPIIFTSILDNIEIGQLSGTNLTESDKGLWGGIAIMGNAPVSSADGDVISLLPGIPTGDQYGSYGGVDLTDDSGIFKYVSIRHAGALIGAGNEINGLSLGAVGSSTIIDHVEIVACQDDGIQILGGTVDVSNVIVGFAKDDGLETSENFDGSISNAVVLCDDISDKGIDMKGPGGTTYTNGAADLSNISILHFQSGTVMSQFRGEVKGTITNVNFGGDIRMTASYESDCQTPLPSALNNLIGSNPLLSFSNCERDSLNLSAPNCSIPASEQTAAESAFPSTATSGADISTFENWTWLGVNGKL